MVIFIPFILFFFDGRSQLLECTTRPAARFAWLPACMGARRRQVRPTGHWSTDRQLQVPTHKSLLHFHIVLNLHTNMHFDCCTSEPLNHSVVPWTLSLADRYAFAGRREVRPTGHWSTRHD